MSAMKCTGELTGCQCGAPHLSNLCDVVEKISELELLEGEYMKYKILLKKNNKEAKDDVLRCYDAMLLGLIHEHFRDRIHGNCYLYISLVFPKVTTSTKFVLVSNMFTQYDIARISNCNSTDISRQFFVEAYFFNYLALGNALPSNYIDNLKKALEANDSRSIVEKVQSQECKLVPIITGQMCDEQTKLESKKFLTGEYFKYNVVLKMYDFDDREWVAKGFNLIVLRLLEEEFEQRLNDNCFLYIAVTFPKVEISTGLEEYRHARQRIDISKVTSCRRKDLHHQFVLEAFFIDSTKIDKTNFPKYVNNLKKALETKDQKSILEKINPTENELRKDMMNLTAQSAKVRYPVQGKLYDVLLEKVKHSALGNDEIIQTMNQSTRNVLHTKDGIVNITEKRAILHARVHLTLKDNCKQMTNLKKTEIIYSSVAYETLLELCQQRDIFDNSYLCFQIEDDGGVVTTSGLRSVAECLIKPEITFSKNLKLKRLIGQFHLNILFVNDTVFEHDSRLYEQFVEIINSLLKNPTDSTTILEKALKAEQWLSTKITAVSKGTNEKLDTVRKSRSPSKDVDTSISALSLSKDGKGSEKRDVVTPASSPPPEKESEPVVQDSAHQISIPVISSSSVEVESLPISSSLFKKGSKLREKALTSPLSIRAAYAVLSTHVKLSTSKSKIVAITASLENQYLEEIMDQNMLISNVIMDIINQNGVGYPARKERRIYVKLTIGGETVEAILNSQNECNPDVLKQELFRLKSIDLKKQFRLEVQYRLLK